MLVRSSWTYLLYRWHTQKPYQGHRVWGRWWRRSWARRWSCRRSECSWSRRL